MQNQPTVSVCMITYGHESYIRQAIEGVLKQICNFEIELILSNDNSPDNTDEVVQDIIENHPKKSWIKYHKQEKNIGMMPNFQFSLKKCSGKYIALCDGDDYWTDTLKLQKQVDFLDENPEYVLCFHEVNILKNNQIINDFITKVPDDYQSRNALMQLGNYIHTPSVVFRNVIEEFPFEFQYSPIGDYFLYIILSEHGKIKLLTEKMAVYRYGVGVYSRFTDINKAQMHLKEYACILSYLKEESIKKIMIQRNFLLISNTNLTYKNFYSSNEYLYKNMQFKDWLKIGINFFFSKNV